MDFSRQCPSLAGTSLGLHCFRRFGATLAKIKGVPDDIIQYMGGWRSDKFKLYFSFTEDDKINFNSQLLQ
jgi:hypothetical protein